MKAKVIFVFLACGLALLAGYVLWRAAQTAPGHSGSSQSELGRHIESSAEDGVQEAQNGSKAESKGPPHSGQAGSSDVAKGSSSGQDQIPDLDEKLLRDNGVRTHTDSLVNYLNGHSDCDEDLLNVNKLVRQLGDEDFDNRTEAKRKLIHIGVVALAPLKNAFKDDDHEIANAARECCEKIQDANYYGLAQAAMRMLVKRRAAGVVETSLRFLPYTNDEGFEQDIYYALDDLAHKAGKVDACVLAALEDKLPARRAVAGAIVGPWGNDAQKQGVRKLLDDPDPNVRLRSAQGLLAGRDKTGIPTLIDLLAAKPLSLAWQAEELLWYVAGDDAPPACVGTDEAADRKDILVQWHKWWLDACNRTDLAQVEATNRRPRFVLVAGTGGPVLGEGDDKNGSIALMGCTGRCHWELKLANRNVFDAQMMPESRLLLVEKRLVPDPGEALSSLTKTPVIRDVTGKQLWSAEGPGDCDDCGWTNAGLVWTSYWRDRVEEWNLITEPNRPAFAWSVPKEQRDLNAHRRWGSPKKTCRGTYVVSHRTYDDDSKVWDVAELVEADIRRNTIDLIVEPSLPEHDITDVLVNGPTLMLRTFAQDKSGPYIQNICELYRPGGAKIAKYRNWVFTIDRDLVALVMRGSSHHSPSVAALTNEDRLIWQASMYQDITCLHTWMDLIHFGFPGVADSFNLDKFSERVKLLESKNPKTVYLALRSLRSFDGREAESALPALVRLLGGHESYVRGGAFECIDNIGATALPVLREAWKSRDANVRLACLDLFIRMHAEDAADFVLQGTSDPDPEVRLRAMSLVSNAIPAKRALPILIDALDDKSERIAASAAAGLGDLGQGARSAVPKLIDAMKSRQQELRGNAAWALAQIHDTRPEVVDGLLACFTDNQSSQPVREQAARTLGDLGKAAAKVIPTMIGSLNEQTDKADRGEFRSSIIDALKGAGADSREAMDAILSVARDRTRDKSLRAHAIWALGKASVNKSGIINALQEMKKQENEYPLPRAIDDTIQVLKDK
jgi:HEAT repeat protein